MTGSDYFPVHAHSNYSTMDGMDDVQTAVDRVVELGQPGFSLTDHGTMAGIVQGYKACRKAGIAFFPGEEFYVVRDVTDPKTREDRFHLGMLALDYTGYQALVRLTTLSYKADRFYRKPLIDLSDLGFLADEGLSQHIAVTTGCYFGLVVQQAVRNDYDWNRAGSMIDMLSRWFPHLYVELQNHHVVHDDGHTDLETAEALYAQAQQRGLPVVIGGDSHYVLAEEQPVHDLMKMVCYFGDGEDSSFPGGPYHLLSSDEALTSLPEYMRDDVEAGHTDLLDKHRLTLPALDNYKFHVPTMYKKPDRELRRVLAEAVGRQDRANVRGLLALDGILDDHWIRTGSLGRDDGSGAPSGLRTVGRSDSSRDDARSRSDARMSFKDMRQPSALGTSDTTGERATLGSTDQRVSSRASVRSDEHLRHTRRQTTVQGVQAGCRSPLEEDAQRYLERLIHEVDVIQQMGMSNYFLLVKEHVTDWCRDNGIIINTRGSANGSLVCFLLGITHVDPIQWGTSFDRFLSLDRMKPPDIDIDVDFRGRQQVISHLRAVFPTMVQVGTYSQIGVTIDPDTGEEKGSVIVQYMAAMSRKDKTFDKRVKPEHRKALDVLAKTPVYKSMGTNAAGFILPGDDLPIDTYLPLGRVISSNTTVTQMSKDDVEALGYMKMDILGLRALQTMNGTLTRIGRHPNEWDWIPWDDKDACKLLRSGNCTGLFQYEGWSSQKGGKEMGIKSTLDTILGLALYRPALMNGGQKDQYLANRGKPRSKQKRLHPIFDWVVKDTAGVLLFQEQVLEVLRTIKMEFKDYNDLMTAVKASNGFIAGAAKTFARIQPIFYDLCEDAGLSDADADDAWAAVVGFTEYGFNRAHATSYGLMSYRSAYLKAHYPLEYMASLLDVWAEVKDKVKVYTAEARRLGFSIVKADVNHSGVSWDIDPTRRNALRKGLVSLDGIGANVAQVIVDNRPPGGYSSIQDFIDRNPARPVTGGSRWKAKRELIGVCRTLHEAGAFRSLPDA